MVKRNVRGYAVNLLRKMLRIYSPTGEEEALSRFLVDEMGGIGFRSWRDGAGNAIGEFGSGEPAILLCGHMDTVPGVLPIKIEGGRIYGRGAVDAKAPLAAMVVASKLLHREGFRGRVVVAGVVEEEGVGKGVKHLIGEGITADYAVFGEPSGVENITIAYKGSLHLKICCRTRAGHSSAPWLYKNAIEEAFKIYELIKTRSKGEEGGSRFYSLTSCATKIYGGSEYSTVPSEAAIHLNLRMPPTLGVENALERVKRAIRDYQAESGGVEVELEVLDFCPPYETEKNSVLVRSLAYAIRRVRRRQAVLVRKTGSGDMNLFGSARGIPVVTYGAGDSHLDHTPDEYVAVDEYLDSIKILCEGLKKLRGMHLRGA